LVSTGHAEPPFDAGVTTVLVCVCVPPPHEELHAENDDHADTEQSTGIVHISVFELLNVRDVTVSLIVHVIVVDAF
jgi:hypothetical protein